ncbi:phage prohead protease [Bacteriophage sp.]|nr:phage prohead protease [Bacteriophage sp.]
MRKAQPIDDNLRRMTVPFELKAARSSDDAFAGEFEGYAAGIHNIDSVGDMILPGAFAEDLPRFLSDGVVCWQHDWMTPIGKPMEAYEDSKGLFTKSRISKTTHGSDAMTLIRDGVVKKLSIGYRVKSYEWVDREGLIAYLSGTMMDEDRRKSILAQYDELELSELFLLKKIKLYEYSPVTVPANPAADITAAKGLLAGLSFRQQSETVLAAVKELATRASEIHTLRANEGRKTTLSTERRDGLQQIADALSMSADSLKTLLLETSGKADTEAANQAFAQFQATIARLNGATV